MLQALRDSPEDDEPLTEEDLAALREAEDDIAAGRVVAHEDLRRRVLS
jgi:predicted transcriptional regulator